MLKQEAGYFVLDLGTSSANCIAEGSIRPCGAVGLMCRQQLIPPCCVWIVIVPVGM